MPITAAELKIIVETVGTKQARDELARTGQAIDQTNTQTQRRGVIAQNAGRAVVGATAAIGAGFAVGVQEAAEFEQQLANINTVARLSEADTNALGDALQQMSRDTGISTDDLTASMYDMVSAGTITAETLQNDLGGAMETMRSTADLAIGGMGTMQGTTNALASALNAYGLESSEAARVTDIFAVAIEKGQVTAEEIGSSLSNVAPIAADAGIELEEISAAYATLTANGVPAAEATTQMRSAIVALLSPNERLKDIMSDTGVNFAEVAKEKGLHVALQQLRDITNETKVAFDEVAGSKGLGAFEDSLAKNQDALGLTNTEMQKLVDVAGVDGVQAALAEMNKMVTSGDAGLSDALGRVEAYNFMLQSTGENATSFGENLTSAMESAGTASEQAAIAMDGPAETAKRLAANVMTWMQDIGGPAASTLGPFLLAVNQLGPAMMLPVRGATALGGVLGGLLGKGLVTATSAMTDMGDEAVASASKSQRLGGAIRRGFSGIASIAGKALGGLGKVFTTLGPKLASGLTAILPALASAASGLVSGLVGLLSAAMPILVAAWPLLLIGAIVAGIALLLTNPEIRDKVFGFIGGVLEWIGDALAGLGDFLGGFFADAFEVVKTVIGKYLEIITFPIRTFIGFLVNMWGAVTGAVSEAWDFISDIIGGVIDFIAGIIQGFIDFLSGMWTGTVEGATTVWTAVQDVINGVIGFITGIITTFTGFLGHIWDGVIAGATTVWNGVKGVIEGIVNTITGIIGGITSVVQGVWDTVSGFFGFITGGTETAKYQMQSVGNYGKGPYTPTAGAPGLAEGTMDTGRAAGLAMLHPHEMVIPRGMANAIRQSIRGESGPPAAPEVGGNTINVTITQPVRVREPYEVAGPLRTLAALGVFNAKPG